MLSQSTQIHITLVFSRKEFKTLKHVRIWSYLYSEKEYLLVFWFFTGFTPSKYFSRGHVGMTKQDFMEIYYLILTNIESEIQVNNF